MQQLKDGRELPVLLHYLLAKDGEESESQFQRPRDGTGEALRCQCGSRTSNFISRTFW